MTNGFIPAIITIPKVYLPFILEFMTASQYNLEGGFYGKAEDMGRTGTER